MAQVNNFSLSPFSILYVALPTSWCNGFCYLLQKEDLHRIMDLLSLKEHHARTLLIHYRWDVEKILAVLVERGKDHLYVDAGVRVTDNANPCSSSSFLVCDICIEERPANKFTTMDCGHYFCNDCKSLF